MSNKSYESSDEDADVEVIESTDEDEKVLREIEEIERREEERLHKKVKGIICDSSGYSVDTVDEESLRDGLEKMDSGEDESYDF